MIHITADPHYGCDNLIKNMRPEYGSTEEHDAGLIEWTNKCVARHDTLIIVGDFCKEKPGRYRPKINCRHIFFILGNHDKRTKIEQVFGGNVWTQRMMKLDSGDRVLCAHHPQCFWDRSHYGVYHAYGHLHYNKQREDMMDLGFPSRRSMDVGVDNAKRLLGEYRPFSEREFLHFLSGREGHDIINKADRWDIKDYEK